MSCDGADSWVNVAEIEAGHYKYYFHYPTLVQDKHRYVPLAVVALLLAHGVYFASPRSRDISTKVGVDKRLEKHGCQGGFTTPKHVHGG